MTASDRFNERFGFPRRAVTLANWRTAPFNRWAFQNVREIVPTAGIAERAGADPDAPASDDLFRETVAVDGRAETVEGFLTRSGTDVFLALKDGRPLAAWTAVHADLDRPHIVFSISKSLTALAAGILADRSELDLEAPVIEWLPEAAGSAYGDATLRHLLDMRVSLGFEEVYGDTQGAFARYRRATLWNPGGQQAPESLFDFLMTLDKGQGEHGGPFRYRSPNSDLLGAVLERASGRRFPELLAELLWRPMGGRGEAHVTVDREGSPRTAGGISVTAWDLARVGELMRQGGSAAGRQVVSERFVRDTIEGGDPGAWRSGDFSRLFAKGRYRNKWYASGEASGSFCAIGIHGQWLFVDPSRAVTLVRFASEPQPTDEAVDQQTLSFFRQISQRL